MNSGTPQHLLLIPGFMSPRWMMLPMFRFLRQRFTGVELWDHPHVFSQPDAVAEALALRIDNVSRQGGAITLVTHSFGDWVGREAIGVSKTSGATKLCSICPVVTSVPIAAMTAPIVAGWIPEVAVMASANRASSDLSLPASIQRKCFWARWDCWVRQIEVEASEHVVLNGTHNSIVLQRNLWNSLAEFIAEQPIDSRFPQRRDHLTSASRSSQSRIRSL